MRVIVETSANENPDDAASLVRFLHYQDVFQLEAILATGTPPPGAPPFIERALDAYGQVQAALARALDGVPTADSLRARLVATGDRAAAEDALLAALDRSDPRPLWYLAWMPAAPALPPGAPVQTSAAPPGDRGTGAHAPPSPLLGALDRLRAERPLEAYRERVRKLRVIGAAPALGAHGPEIGLWIDTSGAVASGADRRLTAHLDLERGVRTSGGLLGGLYPADAVERASRTFLYLLPTGLGVPHAPGSGAWGGRYVPDPSGQTNRWLAGEEDRDPAGSGWSLAAWVDDIAHDFRARLLAAGGAAAINRPPRVEVTATVAAPGAGASGQAAAATPGSQSAAADPPAAGDPLAPLRVGVQPGEVVRLDARASADRNGDALGFTWQVDARAGTYPRAAEIALPDPAGPVLELPVPDRLPEDQTVVLVLAVRDLGAPPRARYRRIVIVRRQ